VTAFDDNVDALEVVEDHAKAVLELEKSQATKVLNVYGDVAKRLRIRLRQTPRDTFTAQQIRVTLMQLEGAVAALEKNLYDTIDLGAELMTRKGVRDLVTEVVEFNDEFDGTIQPINIDLVEAAITTKNRLINTYQASINVYGQQLRQSLSNNLMQMVVERVSPETMYQRLVEDDAIGKFFDGEAWKVRRIVRTELAGIYGAAKQASLERIAENEPAMRKTLYNPMDSRTGDDSKQLQDWLNAGLLKGPNRRLRPKVDQTFVYVWKGKRREFMAPPDRPNDRSILIPYHPSWE
jgi:hypothetical protein